METLCGLIQHYVAIYLNHGFILVDASVFTLYVDGCVMLSFCALALLNIIWV
jgi:hypothetical protein